jgi:lipopolysaccharide transport system ATP-binding protein
MWLEKNITFEDIKTTVNTDIAIKVENLSKVFPLRQAQVDNHGNSIHEYWALKDVSFEIKKGESVGIIGPNGSGKSTLLKILAGITKPTSGKVSIRGKVASILDIGAGFHPELSGRENVYLNGQIHGFTKKEIEVKFNEIVAFSGIEKFIDEPVKNYSNGMYLRLAFSIMAHLDFDVYLLDEVLSVGDEEFREKVSRAIDVLIYKKKTLIFVSHDLYNLRLDSTIIYLFKSKIKGIGDISFIHRYQLDNSPYKHINKESFYMFSHLKLSYLNFFEINNFKIDNFTLLEDGIDSTESIDILFTIMLFKDFSFEIGLAMYDETRSLVFVLTNVRNDVPKIDVQGDYNVKMTLPKNLFNAKTYYFDLFVKKDDSSYDYLLNQKDFLFIKFSNKKRQDIINHPHSKKSVINPNIELKILRK